MAAVDAVGEARGDESLGREKVYTWIGLVVTMGASVLVVWNVFHIMGQAFRHGQEWKIVEQSVYLVIVVGLVYGNLVYQCTRLGYLERLRRHRPARGAVLDVTYTRPAAAPLALLIPSYKEEPRIVRQAVLSAALQSYPHRRVVLLIDDPPNPTSVHDREALAATLRLAGEIDRQLAAEARHHQEAAAAFATRCGAGLDVGAETARLLQQYARVARWFERRAEAEPLGDHTDRLFVELTLRSRVRECQQRARDLDASLRRADVHAATVALWREHRRLASLFRAPITTFERKRYANLSHEPNKAMNLNSYIGLMGRSYRSVEGDEQMRLVATHPDVADRHVPDARYLITLDADSLLHPDYALRLVQVMEQPGNERVAVVQTPYSAVPAAPGVLERLAGATTDMQYLIHQGLTQHAATFWVGANALLRKQALEQICTREQAGGFEIRRYIQDRTVIEDTESSLDLVRHGWRLHNYPERLSYSATPADFGALVIQRQRWANGGVLLLPQLLRALRAAPRSRQTLFQGVLRFHYLSSIPWVNLGLVVAILYPFEDNLRSPWLPLTALPYFCLYGRDLMRFGYSLGDLFRLHVLNLMLIPVNLSGVSKSVEQALTQRKVPFNRTPKVRGRTAAPPFVLLVEVGICLYALLGVVIDSLNGRWLHAFFSAVTGSAFLYALIRLIGVREAWEDVRQGARRRKVARGTVALGQEWSGDRAA